MDNQSDLIVFIRRFGGYKKVKKLLIFLIQQNQQKLEDDQNIRKPRMIKTFDVLYASLIAKHIYSSWKNHARCNIWRSNDYAMVHEDSYFWSQRPLLWRSADLCNFHLTILSNDLAKSSSLNPEQCRTAIANAHGLHLIHVLRGIPTW